MGISFFKDKQKKKRIERWLGRQWVNAIIWATRFLTVERARSFGRVLGNLGFYCLPRHRKQAMRNISLIFGKEKPRQQLREMIRRTFVYAACFGWETVYFYTHDIADNEIDRLVRKVEGLEYLKTATAQGKGVIGLGAHLGNFTMLGRKLDLTGFPSSTIMRQMRDGKLETLFNIMRQRFKQHWIPKFPVSRAVKESIAWLRQGRILMMYIDQRSGQGVTADFMGIPTSTPTGAAVFALKTGAPVLPIVNIQEDDGYYRLIIGPEIPIKKTGQRKQDILVNTTKFNQVIAGYIRQYPDQWFWFHNRWKGVGKNASQ